MRDASDMELLREYARQNSEAAFSELVRRHIALVYSAALRHAGIAAHAEEITQAVFVILARKAARLREGLILEAWLFETTRLTALSFLRGERRRQFREQEAYMQSSLQESTPDPVWQRLAPLLDEAMMRLNRPEREAVVLRYFKEKNLRDVAAAMRITETAAQRRVHRAVGKLQKFLLKRGISSTTASIAENISANSVQAAPAALAKTVTAVALAKGAAVGSSTLTLVKGALKIMAWTKAKTAIVAGAALVLAAGTTTPILVHAVHQHEAVHREQQSISGIGVALRVRGDAIEIDSVLPNTPAAKARLHMGLVIQQIDGTDIVGKPLADCVAMIRGPVGSKVQLEVIDPGKSETNLVEFTREKIPVPAGSR